MRGGLQQSGHAHTLLHHSASASAETQPCFCMRVAASDVAALRWVGGYAELTLKDVCCAVLCDTKPRPIA